MNSFPFPQADFDQADEAGELDPSNQEIVGLMESVYGMSESEVIARLTRFAEDLRGTSAAPTEH